LPAGAPGQDAVGTPWIAASRTSGCVAGSGEIAEVRVDSPAAGSVFRIDAAGGAQQALVLEATVVGGGAARPETMDFVLDGDVVASSSWPYRARVPATAGDHEVVVRPRDARLAVRVGRSRFSVR
jgi:hypothetical protein